MSRTRLAFSACAVALLAGCGASSPAPDDLDVTRVVLYQSGVAYLERSGRVVGDEIVMPIRADQINDILATLVVVDRGVGGGTSVSLPIDESASDRLADLPPELRDAGGLVAVLHAFRGAEVSVRGVGATAVRGRIVGVEQIGGEPHVTLLTNGDAMVPVAIAAIDEVDLRNGSLSTGLRRSLDHSLAEGEWKPTDVTIRFGRSGAHDVTMAYVVEQPIWKPAYRVVVDDDDLLLQGWAVIDNVSGVDWTDVRLSLTAGAPISFRYDLHSPIFVDRPDMSGYGAPDVANLRPPTPIASAPSRQQNRSRGALAAGAAPAPEADYGGLGDMEESAVLERYDAPAQAPGWGADDYRQSGGRSATATEVGAMFRFDIPGRVTLPDQTSTMVTLVNSQVDGEDALVFQPGAGSGSHQHPYRALMLDNSTEAPIQRAPIAIYTEGTFVGQGIAPLVPPGESAVVPYALESRVDITQRASSRSGQVTLTRIIDGVIYTESENIQAFDYEIRSSIDDAHLDELHLQVQRLGGYELRESGDFDADAVQREASYYVIPVGLPAAGAQRTVTIEQVSRLRSTVDPFTDTGKRVFDAYLDRPDARPDVAAALEPVVAMLEEFATVEREMRDARQLRGDVDRRARELRENLAALGDAPANADLRRTLLERLEEQDDQQAELAARIVELSERASALRVLVAEALREIRLEADEG